MSAPQNVTANFSVVAPVITSLSPSSTTATGATFTLTVNGTGFVSGATVQWNGSALTTTFVSSTQLTASVAASLIANTGSASITVVYPGGGTSSAVTLPINPPTPVISSLNPTSATAAGAAFTLTVNGTGYLSGATVQWKGSALPTTFVSSTQLSASVSAPLIASTGNASITVVNPGGTTSNAFVLHQCAAGSNCHQPEPGGGDIAWRGLHAHYQRLWLSIRSHRPVELFSPLDRCSQRDTVDGICAG